MLELLHIAVVTTPRVSSVPHPTYVSSRPLTRNFVRLMQSSSTPIGINGTEQPQVPPWEFLIRQTLRETSTALTRYSMDLQARARLPLQVDTIPLQLMGMATDLQVACRLMDTRISNPQPYDPIRETDNVTLAHALYQRLLTHPTPFHLRQLEAEDWRERPIILPVSDNTAITTTPPTQTIAHQGCVTTCVSGTAGATTRPPDGNFSVISKGEAMVTRWMGQEQGDEQEVQEPIRVSPRIRDMWDSTNIVYTTNTVNQPGAGQLDSRIDRLSTSSVNQPHDGRVSNSQIERDANAVSGSFEDTLRWEALQQRMQKEHEDRQRQLEINYEENKGCFNSKGSSTINSKNVSNKDSQQPTTSHTHRSGSPMLHLEDESTKTWRNPGTTREKTSTPQVSTPPIPGSTPHILGSLGALPPLQRISFPMHKHHPHIPCQFVGTGNTLTPHSTSPVFYTDLWDRRQPLPRSVQRLLEVPCECPRAQECPH